MKKTPDHCLNTKDEYIMHWVSLKGLSFGTMETESWEKEESWDTDMH